MFILIKQDDQKEDESVKTLLCFCYTTFILFPVLYILFNFPPTIFAEDEEPM